MLPPTEIVSDITLQPVEVQDWAGVRYRYERDRVRLVVAPGAYRFHYRAPKGFLGIPERDLFFKEGEFVAINLALARAP